MLVRLGGGLAKGVGDMSHLVTDKVRRTVKFLCAVARGVPIVTPEWLSKVRNLSLKVCSVLQFFSTQQYFGKAEY